MKGITLIISKNLKLLIKIIIISIIVNPKSLGEESTLLKKSILTGPKVVLNSKWIGKNKVDKGLSILILAGHADSQGLAGAGTSGEAVDLKNLKPMSKNISDELFWNLKIKDAIVRIGKKEGLNIQSYDPLDRNIVDGNNPNTNWSIGANHAKNGGYPLEIHFDSYGEYGFGSGLIPALTTNLNSVDESLAKKFGRYPIFFRGGLGAPRRGIRILEVGKLEGTLEKNLRDQNTRQKTIEMIAKRVVDGFLMGTKNH